MHLIRLRLPYVGVKERPILLYYPGTGIPSTTGPVYQWNSTNSDMNVSNVDGSNKYGRSPEFRPSRGVCGGYWTKNTTWLPELVNGTRANTNFNSLAVNGSYYAGTNGGNNINVMVNGCFTSRGCNKNVHSLVLSWGGREYKCYYCTNKIY